MGSTPELIAETNTVPLPDFSRAQPSFSENISLFPIRELLPALPWETEGETEGERSSRDGLD